MFYTNPQYLAETDWLAQHLEDSEIRIIDLRPEAEYLEGHIPGAVFFDMARPSGGLSDANATFPFTWPKEAQFEAVMRQVGVRNDSRVVLYASTPTKGMDGIMWCTRAWWVMHHFGVQCAVLNGGWEKWVAEGRTVSTSPGSYPATAFIADPHWRQGLANKEDVLAALQEPGSACVVDSLSVESYSGTEQFSYGAGRKGHITGAVNVPAYSLVDQDTGLFASANDMRVHFEKAGALSVDKVITYCGAGIAATVDAFALALLGHANVAVYDNSLFEWAADQSLPMTAQSSARGKP